jgi:hypothetical protein
MKFDIWYLSFIPRPEESYELRRVIVYDLET